MSNIPEYVIQDIKGLRRDLLIDFTESMVLSVRSGCLVYNPRWRSGITYKSFEWLIGAYPRPIPHKDTWLLLLKIAVEIL